MLGTEKSTALFVRSLFIPHGADDATSYVEGRGQAREGRGGGVHANELGEHVQRKAKKERGREGKGPDRGGGGGGGGGMADEQGGKKPYSLREGGRERGWNIGPEKGVKGFVSFVHNFCA